MTALAIVAMVLIAVSINPSLLLALPPVLWPIVEIIKSISGSPRTRHQGAEPGNGDEGGGGDAEEDDPDEEDGPENVDHAEEGESVP